MLIRLFQTETNVRIRRLKFSFEPVLLEELKAALGCTEPIAVALASAKARSLVDGEVEKIGLYCSRNVIKNANSVVVPKTDGLKGIRIASAVGAIGGDSTLGLEVLNGVLPVHIEEAIRLIETRGVEIYEKKDVDNLYIEVHVHTEKGYAVAVIDQVHDHFSRLEKNGVPVLEETKAEKSALSDPYRKAEWSVADIYQFAKNFEAADYPELTQALDRVISYNMAISEEGLSSSYGLNVGKLFLERKTEEKEYAEIIGRTASASDARMGGCNSPVVVNSGSGNQGITTSVPVILYGINHDISAEEVYKALLFSGLLGIYQKHFQGLLSSFCGVMSAATASVAAIGFMKGMSLEQISGMITISLSTGGGVFCAGANAMCASKITISLQTAFLALDLVERGEQAPKNEGLAGSDADHTIREIGRLAKNSMQCVDDEILQIMLSRHQGGE